MVARIPHVPLFTVITALALTACGPASPPENASSKATAVAVSAPPAGSVADGGAPASPAASGSLEDVADAFVDAALQCDRERALSFALTYEEASALSTKIPSRADWDTVMSEFFHKLHCDAPAGRAPSEPAKLLDKESIERRVLKASSGKVREDTEAALMLVDVEVGGQRSTLGLVFIKTDHGFKFSPKQ